MIANVPFQDWMRMVGEVATEIATLALGFDRCTIRARGASVGPGLYGPYLPLGTTQEPMQVGLLSDEEGCQRLAKALLGMDANEADLADSDLGDAVSEILNILAGGIKRRAEGRIDLQLGLPTFVKGVLLPSQHRAAFMADLQLGPVTAVVVLASPHRIVGVRPC
jgi:hypothetical protein